MSSDVEELQEVVVTALGITKEKAALGYAVTSVGGEQLEARPEADIARLLRGKVPGVDITSQSGVTGTGTNIIIRGYTSISGSNQPLFVLDGVPIDASTISFVYSMLYLFWYKYLLYFTIHCKNQPL